MENRVNKVRNVHKNIRNKREIYIEQHKDLSTSGSWPGITVYKIVPDDPPSFRPILSGIVTPTYKLAKFLIPMLELLTTNEYTIKDSVTFAEELQCFLSKRWYRVTLYQQSFSRKNWPLCWKFI